jgi:hypothetical protein
MRWLGNAVKNLFADSAVSGAPESNATDTPVKTAPKWVPVFKVVRGARGDMDQGYIEWTDNFGGEPTGIFTTCN